MSIIELQILLKQQLDIINNLNKIEPLIKAIHNSKNKKI